MKKENFSLNVSALATYTDQNQDLHLGLILGAKSLQDGSIAVQYGAIGQKVAINVLKSSVDAVNGNCVPVTNRGTTTFAQPLVTMYPVNFMESMCVDDLQYYYTSMYAQKSFNREDAGDLNEKIIEGKLQAMARKIDDLIWRGAAESPAYAGASTTFSASTGFIQYAYAQSANTINVAKTAVTLTNAIVVLQTLASSVITNAPVLLESGAIMHVSPEDFNVYIPAIVDTYKYNASLISIDKITEFQHPLYPWLTIKKQNGLSTIPSGNSLISFKENFTAVISDEKDMNFNTWFEKKDNLVYFSGKLRVGVGLRQPELLVRVA